jgi:hypothetical protein
MGKPKIIMDNMGKNEIYDRLNKDCEKKMLDAASISRELKKAGVTHPAWYCCLLVRFGELLVSAGTYLKARFSTQPAVQSH